MASKKKVTIGLGEIGASWATRSDKFVSPDDGFGAKPTYHVHPDVSRPEQSAVLNFRTLKEIEGYIEARKKADDIYGGVWAKWGDDYDCDDFYAEEMTASVAADNIMNDFWESMA